MSSKLDNYELSFPQLPKPASVLDLHATVIVSKVPDALSDPHKRKAAIDQITGHELIRSVKPINDKWYINMDKSATEDFCSSIHNIISGTTTKAVSKWVFGISRNIPTNVYITVLGSQQGIKDAKRLGLSKSVKLKFLNSFAQSTFSSMATGRAMKFFLFTILKTYPNTLLNADH